jgi:glycosyltransferase involved in cell wall biosynthesis
LSKNITEKNNEGKENNRRRNGILMRVLFFSHDSAYYGAPQALYELVYNIINKTNITCIVITPTYGILNEKLTKIGVENYSISYFWAVRKPTDGFIKSQVKMLRYFIYNILSIHKIERTIDLKSIDIIHTNTSVIDIGALLAKKHRIIHVWHIRELLEEHFGFKGYRKKYNEFIEKSSNKIITISDVIKRLYISKGIKSNKVSLIYDGIDTELFPNISIPKQVSQKLKCVFVGRICELKGQFDVVKAVSMLPEPMRNNLIIDFYGDFENKYYQMIKEFIRINNMEMNFNFWGFKNDINKLLPTYDIGFVCSKSEGFGRTTVEYMLSEVFPIVSDTGANPELVTDEFNGLLYNYGDISHLCEKIKYIMNNRKLISKYTKNARTKALKEFSLERHVEEIIKIYKSMCYK